MAAVKVQVPLYLPDDTLMAIATIDDLGRRTGIWIEVASDSATAELFKEQIVGLSIVYLARDAALEIVEKKKENTDGV